MAASVRLASSVDSIFISWSALLNDGGWAFSGYSVLVGDGAGGLFTEDNEATQTSRTSPGFHSKYTSL